MQFSKLYLKYKHCPTCRLFCFHYFMKLFAVGVYPRPHVLIKNFFINRGQLVHFLFPHISYFHFLAIITQRSNFWCNFIHVHWMRSKSNLVKWENLDYAFISIKYSCTKLYIFFKYQINAANMTKSSNRFKKLLFFWKPFRCQDWEIVRLDH